MRLDLRPIEPIGPIRDFDAFYRVGLWLAGRWRRAARICPPLFRGLMQQCQGLRRLLVHDLLRRIGKESGTRVTVGLGEAINDRLRRAAAPRECHDDRT